MEYPTLTEARTWNNGNGLFHNNCRHSLSIYIEGISDRPRRRSQAELNRERELYNARQQYNRINRDIRRWRRRRAVAMDESNRARANSSLSRLYEQRRELESRYDNL